MRYLSFLYVLFIASMLTISAQEYGESCYYGISFEMSANPSWGYGEPVINKVESPSPAERAGIKVGDIIMEIDGKATYLRSNDVIADMLYNPESTSVEFSIRNIDSYFKKYRLHRTCVNLNSVSEEYLSQIYSLYSIENTNKRLFTLPLKIETNKDVDYSDYHTFDFYTEGTATEVELKVFGDLEKILIEKGMKRDTKDPEMIIQTYFSYDNNPKHIASDSIVGKKSSFRYDISTEKMVKVPIYDASDKGRVRKGSKMAQLGITFYDRKYIDTKQVTQIWEGFIKDYLSEDYSFSDYLNLHIPLIMQNYPYINSRTNVRYLVSYNKFNYTGLNFDIDDLAVVRDVDRYSPAYEAGIRADFLIENINGKTFRHSNRDISEGYKAFVQETMQYRDNSTKFMDANGFSECAYWSKDKYSAISKAFSKDKYLALFTYLYGFEPYINTGENKVVVQAWNGAQEYRYSITPIIREKVELQILD